MQLKYEYKLVKVKYNENNRNIDTGTFVTYLYIIQNKVKMNYIKLLL